MSEQCCQCRNHHPCSALVADAPGQPDGCGSFGHVEEQRQDSGQRAGNARDVGGADVAAAGFADVASPEEPGEQQAEGNRAEQIRGGGNAEERRRDFGHVRLSLGLGEGEG